MNSKRLTESEIASVECPLSGLPAKLPQWELPVNGDVIRYWRWLIRERELLNQGYVHNPKGELYLKIAKDIEERWEKASIPTIGTQGVIRRLEKLIEKYRNLQKSMKRDAGKEKFEAKKEDFHKLLKVFFHRGSCKCSMFEKCECEKSKKIPKLERGFLEDQCSTRKLMIGDIDQKETKRQSKKFIRKRKTNRQFRIEPSTSQNPDSLSIEGENADQPSEEYDQTTDPDFEPVRAQKEQVYNTKKMTNFAIACERTGISDGRAAMLANAVLEDEGILNLSSIREVTLRTKVARGRKKVRKEKLEQAVSKIQETEFYGMYFDGKKDDTLKLVRPKSCRKVTEEHVTIILEPKSEYKSHVTPKSGSAKSISDALYEDMGENLLDSIKVIGCDGCNVNTGHKGGVITKLEIKLQRPLQWSICLLHMNELPLRALVKSLDGETTGPKGFVGPLGKQLSKAETLPIVDFQPIPSEDLCVKPAELSTDQQYLFRMYQAVTTGRIDESLSVTDPGNINHSRWLTSANRFLRLYVGTQDPSPNLILIVRYIVICYVPTWFSIKYRESIVYGSKNLFALIKRLQSLDYCVQEIVRPVIQNNGYFGHSESILLSMIVDDDIHVRKLALKRIEKARDSENPKLRTFIVPDLNFDAESYGDLIDWKEEYIDETGYFTSYTDPPVLSDLTEEQLLHVVESGKLPDIIYDLPSHNQRVERMIKLVSETSLRAADHVEREGIVHTVIASRKEMPQASTKTDFRMKLKLKNFS